MAGLTNHGKNLLFDVFFRGAALQGAGVDNFRLALCTATLPPTADTNTFSELSEITAGNGYSTGGQVVQRNSTDWDTLTENDTSDLAEIFLKNFAWAASGGAIPASGDGARYLVLLENHATAGSRVVIAFWDLGSARTIANGQTLTLQDASIRLTTGTGFTNKGVATILAKVFRATALANDQHLRVALITSAAVPTADTNTFSELTEIANGNGYTTGGVDITRNSTDWDTLLEDDTNDRVRTLLKDISWTASGGGIPASGNAARYAVLIDNNATPGSRLVLGAWDLISGRSLLVGQTLRLVDAEVRALEA